MRKALWIIFSILILCLCLSFAGSAEISSVDLSTFSLEELNQVKADSYECEKQDFNVGKVKLTEGMIIQIVYGSMDFKPYQGLGFKNFVCLLLN